MAVEKEVLEFVIDAFTPETLPMARLGEYLVHLSALLGERELVHFVQVKKGSARLVHAIEQPAFPKVRTRLQSIRAMDDAPVDAVKAFEVIDRMLRDDGAKADLRRRRDGSRAARLLVFPGASRPQVEEYGPFAQAAHLQGIPISVGGKTSIVNVNIEDGDRVYFCEATRDVAVEIAPLLFFQPIRVSGVGRYFRNADGEWEMRSFRINEFEKLSRTSLSESVQRLRQVTDRTGLTKDVLAKLADLRRA